MNVCIKSKSAYQKSRVRTLSCWQRSLSLYGYLSGHKFCSYTFYTPCERIEQSVRLTTLVSLVDDSTLVDYRKSATDISKISYWLFTSRQCIPKRVLIRPQFVPAHLCIQSFAQMFFLFLVLFYFWRYFLWTNSSSQAIYQNSSTEWISSCWKLPSITKLCSPQNSKFQPRLNNKSWDTPTVLEICNDRFYEK